MVKSLFKKFKLRQGQEPLSEFTDEELVVQYQQKEDHRIVSELMQRYSKHIAAFAWQHLKDEADVEDFVQDVFIKLSEKLLRSEISRFKSWLYAFMKNHLADQRRRDQLFDAFAEGQQKKPEATESLAAVEKKIDHEHLLEALDGLNEKEQKCLKMLFFDEESYSEIMKATGLSFNQVRGIKDRSLKKLKLKLAQIYKT